MLDRLCIGLLPAPVQHDKDFNTHRLCMWDGESAPTDYQINHSDIWWLTRALDTVKPEAKSAYRRERERRKARDGA
jgi:hypothetical protein